MQRIEDNLFALIAARMAGNDLPAAILLHHAPGHHPDACGFSLMEEPCFTRTRVLRNRTDGTQIRSVNNAKACVTSGKRSEVSDISEAHPWAQARPCMESRMLGNLHVRFGKRDGETCRDRKSVV